MVNRNLTILEAVSRPFVRAGLYDSEEEFLADLVRDLAQRKIKSYKNKVRKFEKKHQGWEKFTQELQGKATPQREDEWMEWEAARNMLKAWEELRKELKIVQG